MRQHKPVKNKFFRPLPPPVIIVSHPAFVWFALLLLIISLIVWIIFSDFFAIQYLLCRQGERPCSPATEAELEQYKGKNILLFRADELETKLKKASLVASTVSVKAVLPRTIKVVLSLKQPAITLAEATDSAVLLVDNLTPFAVTQTPEPVQIISSKVGSLRLGEPITDTSLIAAINLNQTLAEHFVPFKFIMALDDRLEVILKEGMMAIFAVDSNFSISAASLQLILKQTTIGQKPKQIDLRFDKPILRF